MITLNVASFMFTVSHNMSLPLSLKEYFITNCKIHDYQTRHAADFHLPLHVIALQLQKILYSLVVQLSGIIYPNILNSAIT